MKFPVDTILVLLILILGMLALLLVDNRKKRKAIRQEELNDAKFEFFSRIDNDLRSPLTMITAPLERLRRENKDTPISKELEDIHLGVMLLQDEIDQLLELKYINLDGESFHPVYGDLADFVNDLAKLYSSVIPTAGSRIVVDTGGCHVWTDFDPQKMRRILTNLLNNAFSNSKDNCKVLLKTSASKDKAYISISSNYGQGGKVRTAGGGRRSKEDSGSIGMNIAIDYVHLHGGSINFSDRNTVTVTIPVVSARGTVSGPAPCDKDGKGKELPHILLVEDNQDFSRFLTGCISDKYDITEAKSGREALSLIENTGFDLILSDVLMPEMDGRTMCRSIRSDIRYADIPIILFTSIPGQESELENLRAGADDSLEKPFDIENLSVRIDRLLQRKRTWPSDSAQADGRMISRTDRELLEHIDSEIEENLQNSEYSIETLCGSLDISRSGLYKKLMSLTGKSPLEYLRMKRIQKGRALLESGETSVSQIAWSVGFSPKQFSKYFKEEYGCLPSEYIHHLSNSRDV